MPLFFPDINAVMAFTRSLKLSSPVCEHCSKQNHLVSHGFVYKQRNINNNEPVGKRILCSKRYGQSGCGKTMVLYVANIIPRFHYSAAKLFIFFNLLLAGNSVDKAYQAIVNNPVSSRNAWRWLNKLNLKQIDFRQFLASPSSINTPQFNQRCQRLKGLLPVIHRLFSQLDKCPCAHYQMQEKMAFL